VPKRQASRRRPRRPTGDRPAARPPPPPDEATRAIPRPSGAAPAVAVLRVLRCPDAAMRGRRFPLASEDVTLGRDPASTVFLSDPDVSRRHARIVRTGNSHVLVDMESTNGVQVNGKPVSEVTLRNGDEVQLGGTALAYER